MTEPIDYNKPSYEVLKKPKRGVAGAQIRIGEVIRLDEATNRLVPRDAAVPWKRDEPVLISLIHAWYAQPVIYIEIREDQP